LSNPAAKSSPNSPGNRSAANPPAKSARHDSFGRLQAVYRGRQVSWRDWTFIFLPLGLLVLFSLAYSIWLIYSAYTRFGPAAALDWPRPWLAMAVLLLLFLAILLMHSLYLSGWRVFVYDRGLGIRRRPFKPVRIPWTQMSGIAFEFSQDRLLDMRLRSTAKATIYPTVGKPFRLDSRLPRLPALVDHIEANLFPLLWLPYTDSLRAGQWLYFGRLAVSKEFLRLGKKQYPWEKVDRLRVEAGRLVIELSGAAPIRLAVAQITNLELLLQLVEREIKL
jgi:hypothetical protein